MMADTIVREGDVTTLKGNIHHSVSAWCYRALFTGDSQAPARMTFEAFCVACAGLGLESVELLSPPEWPAVRKAGLICALCRGPSSIDYGWNRVEHHDDLLGNFGPALAEAAKNGIPNMVTFSGLRGSMSDEQGLEHCVRGLKRLAPLAERHGVTVALELLNSKVDHPDYMADRTAWGVELCRRVGSERIKLLYDIYHMQVMEGDLLRTIAAASPFIGHYHTGGNPGRGEIDDTQEIHYPAVMRAIVATGYRGYVGQEFIPKRDPLRSLQEAIAICDV